MCVDASDAMTNNMVFAAWYCVCSSLANLKRRPTGRPLTMKRKGQKMSLVEAHEPTGMPRRCGHATSGSTPAAAAAAGV